jgi:hypothetical protein
MAKKNDPGQLGQPAFKHKTAWIAALSDATQG